MTRTAICVAALSAAFLALGGCGDGGGQQVTLRYERPASFEVPANLRRVAVADFGGSDRDDLRWGHIASDQLVAALDAQNRRFQRYELVDRKRLGEIMDERDLQMAISDTTAASQVGKLAAVDAMIYGTVHVDTRDEHTTRQVFDPLSRGMKSVPTTKRYCLVTVNFTMDDIATGRTVVAKTFRQEYDSTRDGQRTGAAGIARAVGVGGDNVSAAEQVIDSMVADCVQQFVAMISPHSVELHERLEKGRSDAVKDGNQFAAAGEYADALRLYRQAIELRGDDAGAMFNAGLMSEVLGDFAQAERFYDQALAVKVTERYVQARARVRAAGQN